MNNQTLKKILIALIVLSVLEGIAITEMIKRNIKMYQYLDARIGALEVSIFPGFYE